VGFEKSVTIEIRMIKRRAVLFALVLLMALLVSGCGSGEEKPLGERELVRINNVTFSLEEFRQMSERQPLEWKMRLVSEKGLRDFLENYVITREVLYQEAKKRGFDSKKEIVMKVEDFRRAMAIDALLEETLRDKGEVSDREVQQFYQENVGRFTEPQEVKVRHIFVTSEAVLQEVLGRLSKGERFETLASIYNVDKSREDGGNLGYIRRGQLAPAFGPFEEVAFSLRKKGDISEVVQTPHGYHIIKLDERRGRVVRPLDKVKEKIRFFLQQKKRQEAYLEYVKEAKAKAKIVINEGLWSEEEKKGAKPTEEKK
jgi:peptidyl-prolyl cis-trans isomerase C